MKLVKMILAGLPLGYLLMAYFLLKAGSNILAALMIFIAIMLTIALYGAILKR